MLNRNDRKALRRNRSAVSWLCVLLLFLVVWIKNLYSDIRFVETDYNILNIELDEAKRECEKRKNKIDSLTAIINHKDTSVISEIKKSYKPIVRKDTTGHKVDSIKPLKEENILKDTIK
jgi:hypothetical protein